MTGFPTKTEEEFERLARYAGLKTSVYKFLFCYGNVALNATMYGCFFKWLGAIDLSWFWVLSPFIIPTAVLAVVAILWTAGRVLQLPFNLLAWLLARNQRNDFYS